jgi:hypothetical protein
MIWLQKDILCGPVGQIRHIEFGLLLNQIIMVVMKIVLKCGGVGGMTLNALVPFPQSVSGEFNLPAVWATTSRLIRMLLEYARFAPHVLVLLLQQCVIGQATDLTCLHVRV